MGDDEIVQVWKHRGKVASARGTLLHWHAEMHLNSRTLEQPHSPEFKMFLAILDVLQGQLSLSPFRTELCLFHCGSFLCASNTRRKKVMAAQTKKRPLYRWSSRCFIQGFGRRHRDIRLEAHEYDQVRQCLPEFTGTSPAPARFERMALWTVFVCFDCLHACVWPLRLEQEKDFS